MKKIIFKGSGVAIVTPFTEDSVNYDEFKKLINFQISEGTDAIIVCGTTGESSTMTLEEKKSVIKFTVDTVNKRVPVIAGTGGNCTANSIELSKYAESIGVDGLLLVTPYYNKTTQAGLIAHYKAIANSTNLPIILYSVPSRTGLNITPATCLELSKIENIVAIKEASGNLSQIAEIAYLCKDNLNIYSGNDDQILPILSLGGLGVISVLANVVPKFTHDMVNNFFNGDFEASKNAQLQAIPLVSALFSEVNPIPVKAAIGLIGYNAGVPRLPLIEMSEPGKEKLKIELKKFNLI
ncbi:MAG: 4-hydroxy-tetrahydrodipicolinate synthase [Lachnospiraceae bacterium]|jgi:4-hydroxy-tetrahydrodipicolinate synthase|nr:4-hydroxy-tetrahydrodipicolinate synthase [Lachnospiraceae bacterium]